MRTMAWGVVGLLAAGASSAAPRADAMDAWRARLEAAIARNALDVPHRVALEVTPAGARSAAVTAAAREWVSPMTRREECASGDVDRVLAVVDGKGWEHGGIFPGCGTAWQALGMPAAPPAGARIRARRSDAGRECGEWRDGEETAWACLRGADLVAHGRGDRSWELASHDSFEGRHVARHVTLTEDGRPEATIAVKLLEPLAGATPESLLAERPPDALDADLTCLREPPELLERVAPEHPVIFSSARRECVLRCVVTASGETQVRSLLESSGVPSWDAASAAAVARWTYRPATCDGRPVDSFLVVRLVNGGAILPLRPARERPDRPSDPTIVHQRRTNREQAARVSRQQRRP